MSVIYGLSLCIQPPPSVEEIRLKWGGCCTQATAALGSVSSLGCLDESEVLPTRGGTERSAALGFDFFFAIKVSCVDITKIFELFRVITEAIQT